MSISGLFGAEQYLSNNSSFILHHNLLICLKFKNKYDSSTSLGSIELGKNFEVETRKELELAKICKAEFSHKNFVCWIDFGGKSYLTR